VRRTKALVAGVAVLLIAVAGYRYAVVMRSLHRLGMTGWSLSAAGECHVMLQRRELTCGRNPANQDAPRTESTQLSLGLLTGDYLGYHSWILPDSASWLATTDSIRRALTREGGKALQCRIDASRDEPALAYEVWQWPTQAMRLFALKARPGPGYVAPWQVNIMTVGRSGFGCDFDRRRRLLTPREMIQRLMQQKMEF